MLLLLVWSIFNGLLGFFVGHIFNASTGNWAALIVWIAFAICIPVIIAVAMFRYLRSYELVSRKADTAHADAIEQTAPAAGAPVTQSGQEETEGNPEPDAASSKKGWFSARCNNIASHYLLSKRETEVLFLLAKGHNAAFIQEQLCVSRSTAKTHINHIYRKLDIHTQQELLNMVEDRPRGREDGRVVGSFPGVMQIDNPIDVMKEAYDRKGASPQKNYRKDIFSDKA